MNTATSKNFSWKTAILFSVGAGLLTIGLSVAVQAHGASVHELLAVNPKSARVDTAVGLGSSFQKSDQPARLVIPSIGVNAKIQSMGLSKTGDGSLGVPTNFTDVAWYKAGPVPGMPGSAVIDGHVDGKHVPKAVFYSLSTLKKGDMVNVINVGGHTLKFKVVGSKTYAYNDTTADIFASNTSAARLNLITCAGTWMKAKKLYDKRVVIFTELVTT